MDDLAALARLVDALRPWLRHLVVVGGWAHRLHRFHPMAAPPAYRPLRTRDADLAFSPAAPLAGDIGAALRAGGFREEMTGEHVPPVTRYVLADEDAGFYAEFLAPLLGAEHRRDGTPDATLARAGITAQKLRHLDLLLVAPWSVSLDPTAGVPLAAPADVLLPNPVSFLAQKLLIQGRRTPARQAQDALYIHDTLALFGAAVDELRVLWREEVRPTLSDRTALEVERLARERFATVNDVVRTAARMPQDRTLAPERLRALCAFGLEEIFAAA